MVVLSFANSACQRDPGLIADFRLALAVMETAKRRSKQDDAAEHPIPLAGRRVVMAGKDASL